MGNSRQGYANHAAPANWGETTPAQRRMLTLGGLAVFLLLYSVVIYGGLVESTLAYWWTDLAWTIASLAAGLKCLGTARAQNQRQLRLAWTFFGLAALSWFVGMLIWDYLELIEGRLVPYPSPADYFFDGFAVLAIVGAFYFRTQATSADFTLTQIANFGIILCTIVAVVLIVLFEPITSSSGSPEYIGLAISHAVTTMAAFAFAVFCYWFYSTSANAGGFVFILLALAVHGVTNVLYSLELLGKTFGAANQLNVLWLLAFAFQYWAAFEQDELTRRTATTRTVATPAPYRRSLEAVTPGLCLLAILAAAFLYQDQLNETLLHLIGLCTALFAGFLVVREWWIGRVEEALLIKYRNSQQDLERRVGERTAELAEANRELEAFAYSVSHDLRSPLRAINGFSAAIIEELGDRLEPVGRDYLQRIRAASDRMGTLIDDLLELSRMTRQELRRQEVDLGAIAQDVIDQLRGGQPERTVEVEVGEGLIAHGDPVLLKSAIANLVGNAWKYTRRNSHAHIEFKHAPVRTQGRSTFFIRDNGVGFDMKYAAKLFTPFQRLHTPAEFEGTGIGLAIVARIIKRHGGRVWVEAEPEKGATFWFEIPDA